MLDKPERKGRPKAVAQTANAPAAPPCAMVIFGASGDLTKRLLVPALYNLSRTGLLPEHFAILGVDAVLSHGAQPGYEKSWKTDPIRCGGGVCIDPGIHLFDLFVWMFGGAELAAGHLSQQFWQIQVEDHASLILTLPGGVPASVNLSLSSWQSRMEITVETERAQFLLRGRGKFYGAQRLTVVTKWPWLQPEQPREVLFDYGMEDVSLQLETEEFIAACTGANANLTIATAAHALQSMRIVDNCYSKLPQNLK